MPRRRTFLKISALLLLFGATALAVFIATFDLDRYRALVEKSLAGALDRPVEIASAHLSVRHGLALDLTGLRIGPADEDRSELSARHLYLKLDLQNLLTGRITLDEIILDQPHLELRFPPANHPEPQISAPPLPDYLLTAHIHSLRVEDGTLRIHDSRGNRTFAMRDIQGRIDDLALKRRGHLEVTGELAQPEGTAAFELKGEVEPPADFSRWHETDGALTLTLDRLDPKAWINSLGTGQADIAASGRCSLALRLEGSPEAGLRFDGSLDADGLTLHGPSSYRIPDLAFSGKWTAAANAQRLSELHIQTGDLSLDGELALIRHEGVRRLEGGFSSPPLPMNSLKRLLPEEGHSPPLFDFLDERLVAGTLQVETIRLDGPLGGRFPLKSAIARIRDGVLRLPETGDLKQLEGVIDWKDGRLDLRDGKFLFAGESLFFSGSLTQLETGPPEIALEAYGTLPAEALFSLLPPRDQLEMEAKGPIPVSLALRGPTDRLVIDLKSDLKHLAINFESKLRKPAGLEARLFITAELTPDRLELSHGLLSIPPMELRARGTLGRDPQRPFALSLDLAPLDMQQARFRTPLLDRFEPQGRIALEYRLAGTWGDISEQGGKLLLRDFGMRLPGPLSPLRRMNGEMEIENGTARITRLSARLGSSAVTATGKLETGSAPRLELHVVAPSIRADELIFPRAEKVFHDVDGRLVITRDRLSFAPVHARLGEDTAATVRGTVENFKAPEVRLEIEAARADITDVIGLWKKPPGAEMARKKKKRKVKVFIDTRVENGSLGPLHFRNGHGHIETREDLLVIYPLRFEAGEGNCTGQVVLDRSGPPPALLKISGHLQNISAAGLHSELLRKRGMITGTLNGDFYLEGRIGPTFLPTSIGGFNLKVKEGVLRRFRFLSKVFSLLNVSQLFEFNLPDVDDEGMPFERLTGSFGLRQGILSTDDLFVKSNAMNLSLVGNADLVESKLDFILGVKPLRTVDKIVTQIPIAGWLLTGDEKALLTAHFLIGGEPGEPEVLPIPITSVSEKVFGIFRRIFSLPAKLVTDPEDILRGED